MSEPVFTTIPEALEAFANGQFLVVMDDESRENEGDLIISAQHITTEKMAFMVRHTSGYICAPMSIKKADELELPLMLSREVMTDPHGTAYTITVDAKEGTTTGISAHDRALTCRTLAKSTVKPEELTRPGHVCPLRAMDSVLIRDGHTEAAVELCRLCGLEEVAVICELVRDDGAMMRLKDCWKFAEKFGLKLVTIADLVNHVK